MKKVTIASLAAVVIFTVTLAVAQEPEGLIPRLIKKYWKKAPQAEAAKAAVKAEPAKSAEPLKPAAVPESVIPEMSPAAKEAVAATARTEAGSSRTELGDTVKTMSKEELVKEIASEIADEEEVLDYIPDLRKKTDSEGKEYLVYNIGGMLVRLEELEKEKLEAILSSVYNKATMISTRNIQAQLETVRQIQNIARQTAVQRAIPTVPSVPPAPPRTPSQPPRVPPSPPPDTRR